jgi:hypothetical protein
MKRPWGVYDATPYLRPLAGDTIRTIAMLEMLFKRTAKRNVWTRTM